MTQRSGFVHTLERTLSQFPGFVLLLHQLWLPAGRSEAFDETDLFRRLIRSGAYQNQRWNHSSKGEHGPFAVSKIRPDHYERISSEELEKTLQERVIPASKAELDRYLDPWPNTDVLQRRLMALLKYIQSHDLRWYRLAIGLEDEQYWSEGHREVPILDHFEEWVAVDPEGAMIYMLQLIRD